MKVRVLAFAALSRALGFRERVQTLPDNASVGDLLNDLQRDYPDLKASRDGLAIAVNQEYARQDQPLGEGDEVALIPPVSGG